MEHAQGAAGRLPGAQEPGLAEAPGGGRRVPPQEEAPGRGMGARGGPALGAKATERGGRRLGRGRAQARVPMCLGPARVLSEGPETQTPDSISTFPLAIRAGKETRRVWERVADRATCPTLTSSLEPSYHTSQMGIDLISVLPQELEGASPPPQSEGRPLGSS